MSGVSCFCTSIKLHKNNDLYQWLIWIVLLRCKSFAFRLPSLTLGRVLHFASKLTEPLQPVWSDFHPALIFQFACVPARAQTNYVPRIFKVLLKCNPFHS